LGALVLQLAVGWELQAGGFGFRSWWVGVLEWQNSQPSKSFMA